MVMPTANTFARDPSQDQIMEVHTRLVLLTTQQQNSSRRVGSLIALLNEAHQAIETLNHQVRTINKLNNSRLTVHRIANGRGGY